MHASEPGFGNPERLADRRGRYQTFPIRSALLVDGHRMPYYPDIRQLVDVGPPDVSTQEACGLDGIEYAEEFDREGERIRFRPDRQRLSEPIHPIPAFRPC